MFQDGKIYVNGVLKGEATKENLEEIKVYNEKMREWTKALHSNMFETMKRIIDDMFGDHGSFWQNLSGPFWKTVKAYGPDSEPTKPATSPKEPEKPEKPEKPLPKLPETMPLPEPPSFCKP
ncbi:unnamed protein product [Gongylonema pulchrum]|uniref:Pepsin inhibitor-3-like repeated domain-containing protein n=1 Tax=Gongylonema pulchrum TaxID=637853 RepID=A0A3P7RM15_9BILA|nr:unnamed protein product [Gongylonema pulchrum]